MPSNPSFALGVCAAIQSDRCDLKRLEVSQIRNLAHLKAHDPSETLKNLQR